MLTKATRLPGIPRAGEEQGSTDAKENRTTGCGIDVGGGCGVGSSGTIGRARLASAWARLASASAGCGRDDPRNAASARLAKIRAGAARPLGRGAHLRGEPA